MPSLHIQQHGNPGEKIDLERWKESFSLAAVLGEKLVEEIRKLGDYRDYCVLSVVRITPAGSRAHFYLCQVMEETSGTGIFFPAHLGGEMLDLGQVGLSSDPSLEEVSLQSLLLHLSPSSEPVPVGA